MKKRAKILLCLGAVIFSFAVTNRPVYAYSDVNALGIQNIGTNILRTNSSKYDYSGYSKQCLQDLFEYLNSADYKTSAFDYLKFEVAAEIGNGNHAETGNYLHPLYLLKDRIEFEIENSDFFKEQYRECLKAVNEDITAYEEKLTIQELFRAREDLISFRESQIQWSDYFLSIYDEEFNWENKNFSVSSIDIYDFFSDGRYHAPVKNQSLDLISTKYSENHYGMDINLYEGDRVFSIANNATVEVKKNEVCLKLDTGALVIYRNIKTSLKTGDVVNAGDVIGVYKQRDHDYNGLFVSLVKENREYSPEWLMTEYPFITYEGMSMPLYRQSDKLWGDMSFGCSTIGPSGCGPSALAMAISYKKNEIITPAEVVTEIGGADTGYYCPGKGSYWTLIDDCPEMYGLKCARVSTSEVIDCLRVGNPVIAIMGPGQFTSGGHFITLSGVDEDDRIYVNDSADNFDKMHYDQTFTLRSIANECSCFWVVYSGDSYK